MRLVTEYDGKEYAYEVRKDLITIGRDVSCDISLNSTSVSRFHCQCRREGDDLFLKDLGSRNGTLVNQTRVSEVKLRDGDVVRVGKVKLRFQAEGAVPPPAGFREQAPSDPAPPPPAVEAVPAGDADGSPTPVDLEFAPEQARAQLPVGGPQLLQREGKWYLKDPAGGREVEIRPVHGGGDPMKAAIARLREAPPGTKRTLALAAAVLLVAIGTAAVLAFMKKGAPPPSGPAEPAMTAEQYAALVDEGIATFRTGLDRLLDEGRAETARESFAAARLRFRRAHEALPYRNVAGLLDALVPLWEEVRPDLDNFDDDRMGRMRGTCRDIQRERVYPPSTDVTVFCADLVRKLGAIHEARERQAALIERSRSDDVAALEALLPEIEAFEGRFAGPVRSRIEPVRARIREHYLDEARRGLQDRYWDRVPPAAAAAVRYGLDPAEAERLEARAELERAAQTDLNRARDLRDEGRFDLAIEVASRIPEGSAFHVLSRDLIAQLERDEVLQRVHSAFDRGEEGARSALEILEEAGLETEIEYTTLRGTLEAWTEVQMALDAFDLERVVERCDRIRSLLAAPIYDDNRFLHEADALHDRWRTPSARSRAYRERGDARRGAGTLQGEDGALAWYLRARETDPTGAEGDAADMAIAELYDEARDLRVEASIHQRDTDRALRLLDEALHRLLPPGVERAHDELRGKILELRTRLR